MSKIFVVDDSIGACIAVERILGARDFDVVWERQGETGLMTVEKHTPDLILCDLVMPDIDGFEFCRSVKENPLLMGTPVVLMSGVVDQDVHKKASEIGLEGVLPKPFTPEQLVEVVENILDRAGDSVPAARLSVTEEERWAPALETLAAMPAMRFACVLDDAGQAVAGYRRQPGVGKKTDGPMGSVGSEDGSLSRFAHSFVELTKRLRLPLVRDMTLESDEGVLILRPLANGYLLVVAIDDRCFLGKARYLTRKWEA